MKSQIIIKVLSTGVSIEINSNSMLIEPTQTLPTVTTPLLSTDDFKLLTSLLEKDAFKEIAVANLDIMPKNIDIMPENIDEHVNGDIDIDDETEVDLEDDTDEDLEDDTNEDVEDEIHGFYSERTEPVLKIRRIAY